MVLSGGRGRGKRRNEELGENRKGRKRMEGWKEGRKGKRNTSSDHLQNPGSANASEPDQIMQNYKQKV
jgi:hypothetical protein